MKKSMENMMNKHKICSIVRHLPLEKTLDYATTLYDCGIRMIEVATNSEEAYEQIKLLRYHFNDKLIVGAGTVINNERCNKSLEAGAHFFLTPSTTRTTLEFCQINNIPLLPGVMTPTDVSICLDYGYNTMKLFPAADLSANYIKSLKGPFDGTNYVAVGGVSPENINSFFSQGFIGVGIGSHLIPNNFIENNDWDNAKKHLDNIMKNIKFNK